MGASVEMVGVEPTYPCWSLVGRSTGASPVIPVRREGIEPPMPKPMIYSHPETASLLRRKTYETKGCGPSSQTDSRRYSRTRPSRRWYLVMVSSARRMPVASVTLTNWTPSGNWSRVTSTVTPLMTFQ